MRIEVTKINNLLTGIQVRLHICNHFQTSFVLELVAMSVFALKLRMIVTMKVLLSLYNMEISTTNKAQNGKELCLFKNPAFFVQYAYFFNHQHQPWRLPAPPPASW